MVDLLLQQLLLDTDQDLESTRKAFAAESSYWQSKSLLAEQFDVIFYGDDSDRIAGYLIIPRQPELAGTGHFAASMDGKSAGIRSISELQQTLAELNVLYPH